MINNVLQGWRWIRQQALCSCPHLLDLLDQGQSCLLSSANAGLKCSWNVILTQSFQSPRLIHPVGTYWPAKRLFHVWSGIFMIFQVTWSWEISMEHIDILHLCTSRSLSCCCLLISQEMGSFPCQQTHDFFFLHCLFMRKGKHSSCIRGRWLCTLSIQIRSLKGTGECKERGWWLTRAKCSHRCVAVLLRYTNPIIVEKCLLLTLNYW